MNQVVHIFRKDCRHLWSNIAAVLVLTFLHGYGYVIIRGGGVGYAIGLSPYMLLFVLAGLSGILLPIALFLLVVSVIQEESLVGSDKFWLTRPYSRRSLFLVIANRMNAEGLPTRTRGRWHPQMVYSILQRNPP